MVNLQSNLLNTLRYGLVARIPGSHPGGSGSIPGTGMFPFFCFFLPWLLIISENQVSGN
jgi:hypothetical protein